MKSTTILVIVVAVVLLAILMTKKTTATAYPAGYNPYSTGTTAGASTWGGLANLGASIVTAFGNSGSGGSSGSSGSQYDVSGGGYDTSSAYNEGGSL
jgi:hypothetical protein